MKNFIAAFAGGLVIAYLIVLGAAGGNPWLLIVMLALLFAVFCTIFGSLFNKLEQLEAKIMQLTDNDPSDVSRETSDK